MNVIDSSNCPKKVSVIVPVYNVEKYIDHCLDSLVNQTLQEIEIIVVNDGSTDNSQNIIEKYANNYSHMVKVFSKENGGLSDARNYGICHAEGEYIGFVDSDDFVEPNMFEIMYEKAIMTNADIIVCSFNHIYDSGKIKHISIDNKFGAFDNDLKEMLVCAKPYAWNKIYRRAFFINTGISYPKGQYFEDSAVTYNLIYLAKHIEFINDPLYNYRYKRKDSITGTINKKFYDIFLSCNSFLSFFKAQNAYEDYREELEYLCIIHIFARIKSLVNSSDKMLINDFVDDSFNYLNTNFPNWRLNKYYWHKRQPELNNKKPNYFTIVRDQKNVLKKYLLKNKRILKLILLYKNIRS